MGRISRAIIGGLLLIAARGRPSVADPITTVPALNPSTGTIKAVALPNVVWMTRDSLGKGGSGSPAARSPSFRFRYYVQKVGAETASLAFETVTNHPPDVLTVLPDETVIFQDYLWLIFAKPGEKPEHTRLKIDSIDARATMGWSDGLLICRAPDAKRITYFVPIKEGSLDYAAKIRIMPPDASLGGPTECVRYKRTLGWATGDRHPAGFTIQPRFYLFDLDTRTVRSVALEEPRGIVAFDDKYGFGYDGTIDLQTGKKIGEPPLLGSGWMAIHDGYGYMLRKIGGGGGYGEIDETLGHFELRAYDFFAPRQKHRVLASFPSFKLAHPGSSPRPFDRQLGLPTEQGLEIWNGEKWLKIDWLKRDPR
jgi:hypothetical protein